MSKSMRIITHGDVEMNNQVQRKLFSKGYGWCDFDNRDVPKQEIKSIVAGSKPKSFIVTFHNNRITVGGTSLTLLLDDEAIIPVSLIDDLVPNSPMGIFK